LRKSTLAAAPAAVPHGFHSTRFPEYTSAELPLAEFAAFHTVRLFVELSTADAGDFRDACRQAIMRPGRRPALPPAAQSALLNRPKR
jgi:hypothetical protein